MTARLADAFDLVEKRGNWVERVVLSSDSLSRISKDVLDGAFLWGAQIDVSETSRNINLHANDGSISTVTV